MIIKDEQLPPIPIQEADAPPPYQLEVGSDQPVASSSTFRRGSSSKGPGDDSKDRVLSPPIISVSPSPASSPTSSLPSLTSPSTNTVSLDTLLPHRASPRPNARSTSPRSSISSISKKKSTSWFRKETPNKTHEEIITRVKDLVKNLIRPDYTDHKTSQAVLQGCQEACNSYALSFSDVLQSPYIEGHIPLYWGILNRSHDSGDFDLITNMLHFSLPLAPSTISEIRRACLARGDQPLFQRLRLSSVFAPLSGTDEMLLGGSVPPDNITVQTESSDDASFMAHFEIAHFQKRMRVSKEVELEFIARSRLWKVVFTDPPEKKKSAAWIITLSLLEDSPPTFVDSQFLILDSATQSPTAAARDSFVIDPISSHSSASPSNRPSGPHSPSFGQSKPRPPIPVVLKSTQELVSSEAKAHGGQKKEIKATLDHNLSASSLQNSGSSYLSVDDTLRGRWEVKLAKPESEGCLIC